MYIYIYIYIYIYLIVKEEKRIKKHIFTFRHTVFYENFLPTTHSINLHLAIIALALDFARN